MRPNASGRPGCMATCQKSMVPSSAEHVLDEVVDADGDAARGQHDVGHGGGLAQARAQLVARVGHDAEVEHVAAALLDGRRAA